MVALTSALRIQNIILVGQRPLFSPPTLVQLGEGEPLAGYTFSRSLAKSWPSFRWSKLAMNCWQDIFLPMFCNGETVLPESRGRGWCHPHTCPAQPEGMRQHQGQGFPLSPRVYKTLFFTFKIYLVLKHHERLGFSSNPVEGVRLNAVL